MGRKVALWDTPNQRATTECFYSEGLSLRLDAEAQRALDIAAGLGADYTDVRFGTTRDEHIEVRNGVVSSLADGDSTGFSVRTLVNGAWGFASSAQISDAEIERVTGL